MDINKLNALSYHYTTHQVQFSSVTQLCPTLCDPMNCSTPGFLVLHCLPEFAQTHVHWVGDATQTSHPLSSPSPPACTLPSIRVFSNESVLPIRWPKYWSFSFSISPSSEYSGLISLGLTGLFSLQSKGLSRVFSNTTVQKHQFFGTQVFSIAQLSHPYMTTGKTIALTRWTFVSKVMSLPFNMPPRFGLPWWLR